MGSITWSESAGDAFSALPAPAQDEVLRVIGYIQLFPRMYPMAPSKHFRGCRRAVVLRRYLLYYRVSPASDDCRMVAIVDARRTPM